MDIAKFFDEKKFMWDGKTYSGKSEVNDTKTEYEKNNFETRIVPEGSNFFLFTRRVVTEIVIENQ